MKSLLICAVLLVATSMGASLPATVPPRPWKRVSAKSGEMDLSKKQQMTIGLKRQNMDQLEKIFWDVSDPMSENFGNHLKHEQMRDIISVGPAALSKVTAWLKENGIEEFEVARHEDAIAFDAPAAKIEKLLKVKFAMYESGLTKERVMRACGQITIPDALAGSVDLISGHRGFPVMLHRPKPSSASAKVGSQSTNVTPAKIYDVYNQSYFPTTPAGQKNIQSFFQASGQWVDSRDLKDFCKALLPDLPFECNITKYIYDKDHTHTAGTESSLDSEYITATGRGTETWSWTYNSQDFCGDLARWGMDVLQRKEFPWTISISYGLQGLPSYCMGPDTERLKMDMMKMGSMGISVSVSSGDSGSAEYSRVGYNYGLLGPNFLASVPYCTAVGSTTFVAGNSGEQEATVSFGSGGGFSFDYAMPDYQKAAVTEFLKTDYKLPPRLSYNASGRATPDISFLGDGFYILSQGIWEPVAGTSCSSPSWAGMVTMLNNIRLENGKTMGFINPFIYANPQGFTDIVKGNNDVSGDGMGWYATKGWDACTGLGTPNWGMLADAVKAINARENAAKQKK